MTEPGTEQIPRLMVETSDTNMEFLEEVLSMLETQPGSMETATETGMGEKTVRRRSSYRSSSSRAGGGGGLRSRRASSIKTSDSLLHEFQVGAQQKRVSFPKLLRRGEYMFYAPETGALYGTGLSSIRHEGRDFAKLIETVKWWWLDVTGASNEEMQVLGQVFQIHPLTLEDIMMEESGEKCDVFSSYYFVIYKTVLARTEGTMAFDQLNLNMLVRKSSILSFHQKPTNHVDRVLERVQYLQDFLEVTPDWINYALIDDVTDLFEPLVQEMRFEADAIDELVLVLTESEHSDMLKRIANARRRLTMVLRLLMGKEEVMKTLIKRCEDLVAGDIRLYLSDVQDHVQVMLKDLHLFEKTTNRAHSNYLAQISIDLSELSNKANAMMAKVTLVAFILVPMTLISGNFLSIFGLIGRHIWHERQGTRAR